MTETGQNIEFHQGDYKELVITIVDSDGNAIDITGGWLTWVAYKRTGGTIYITKDNNDGITLTDPTNGEATVVLNPVDTINLLGDYLHECEFVDTNNHPTTVLTGYFKILLSKANKS